MKANESAALVIKAMRGCRIYAKKESGLKGLYDPTAEAYKVAYAKYKAIKDKCVQESDFIRSEQEKMAKAFLKTKEGKELTTYIAQKIEYCQKKAKKKADKEYQDKNPDDFEQGNYIDSQDYQALYQEANKECLFKG
ncbi:MAG: hypothetical protein ACTSXQ_00260 [Alphaproteobacteria bacterium]